MRILLGSIERHAVKYKRKIVPIVSLSVDYYIRVFVRVYTSPGDVKFSASKMGNLLQCVGCLAHHVQPMMKVVECKGKKGNTYKKHKLGQSETPTTCLHCGSRFQIAGPAWIDNTFDKEVLGKLLQFLNENKQNFNSFSRLYGLLTVMNEVLLFLSNLLFN